MSEHVPKSAESRESLWWLAFAPAVWIAHMLASYLSAAIYCAKAGRDANLGSVRFAIGIYTAVALIALTGLVVRGVRRRRRAGVLHDDTPNARHAFLGLAVLMLGVLAMFGVVFVAMPVFFTETCR